MEIDVLQELESIKKMVYSHIKTIDVNLKFSDSAMLSIYKNMRKNIQGCTVEYEVFHTVEDLCTSYIEISFPKIIFRADFDEDVEDHNYKVNIIFKNKETHEILFRTGLWAELQKFCRGKSLSDKLKEIVKNVDSEGIKKLTALKEENKDNPLVEKVYNQYILIYNAQKELNKIIC